MAGGAWIAWSRAGRMGAADVSAAGQREARGWSTRTELLRELAFVTGVSLGIPIIVMWHLATVLAPGLVPLT